MLSISLNKCVAMPFRTKPPTLFRIVALAIVALTIEAQGKSAYAMELAEFGSTIILSGPVIGSELVKVKNAFTANPKIDLVVLRNSFGGDAWTGYRVGEFFREMGVTTAVSGYCISSCSRMFLGGKNRLFTDDYPLGRTWVGFHGHYDSRGNLDRSSVAKGGLYDWIIRYSDGKADPELVKRWVSIEQSRGAANFFPPELATTMGHSVFFCDGLQPKKPTNCEPVTTNAMQRGVVTDNQRISSPDKETLTERIRAHQMPATQFAKIDDVGKVPLDIPSGIEQYQRYLAAPTPKAFAIAPSRQHWAWNMDQEGDVNAMALKRCSERSKQTCVLYGVDDNVVYKE